MENFAKFIKSLRMHRNLTVREAAAQLKISPSRLGELERGKTYARDRKTLPSRELITRMAELYGPPEELMLAQAGIQGAPPKLTPEEQQAIALFHILSTDGRQLALGMLRLLAGQKT